MKEFLDSIARFNDMYKTESNDKPTFLGLDRVEKFYDIIKEEVDEAIMIVNDIENESACGPEDTLVAMADWLGDIIVYCASEARRWGIPLEGVLKIIMESNFSKLGADGKPIYDERGKVMKGPGYWKPEAKIEELLKEVSK